MTWLLLAASPAAVFFGAKFTVDAVIDIAEQLQIGTEVVALSAVALGTSLPELVVAISAARRGEAEIVVGNVIGSNIFNTFAVMGVPSLLGNLTVPQSVLDYSLPTFFGVTLLLVFVIVDRRMTKAEGAFLMTFYAFFIGRLFEWI
jgi:cation:H+ antiporter